MTTDHRPFPASVQQRIEANQQHRSTQGLPQRRSVPNIPPLANPSLDSMPSMNMDAQGPQNFQRQAAQAPRHPMETPGQPVPPAAEQAQYAAYQSTAQHAMGYGAQQQMTPIAETAQLVANPNPGFTNPIADAESISVALPSRFAFYPFKDLYVRRFTLAHAAKLSKANSERSLQPVVEAVSSVLSTTTPGNWALGYELTLNDFYFVLYWLRMHSYTKANYMHTTTCKDPKHLQAVKEGRKAQETLKITELVRRSDLQVTELETVPDPEQFFVVYQGTRLPLRPATMRDTLDYTEHPLFNDPEFNYLAALACFISSPDGTYLPIEKRVEIVGTLTPDEGQIIKNYEKLLGHYGVEERITVRCKECGASQVTKMTLDASSFLPSAENAGNPGSSGDDSE